MRAFPLSSTYTKLPKSILAKAKQFQNVAIIDDNASTDIQNAIIKGIELILPEFILGVTTSVTEKKGKALLQNAYDATIYIHGAQHKDARLALINIIANFGFASINIPANIALSSQDKLSAGSAMRKLKNKLQVAIPRLDYFICTDDCSQSPLLLTLGLATVRKGGIMLARISSLRTMMLDKATMGLLYIIVKSFSVCTICSVDFDNGSDDIHKTHIIKIYFLKCVGLLNDIFASNYGDLVDAYLAGECIGESWRETEDFAQFYANLGDVAQKIAN